MFFVKKITNKKSHAMVKKKGKRTMSSASSSSSASSASASLPPPPPPPQDDLSEMVVDDEVVTGEQMAPKDGINDDTNKMDDESDECVISNDAPHPTTKKLTLIPINKLLSPRVKLKSRPIPAEQTIDLLSSDDDDDGDDVVLMDRLAPIIQLTENSPKEVDSQIKVVKPFSVSIQRLPANLKPLLRQHKLDEIVTTTAAAAAAAAAASVTNGKATKSEVCLSRDSCPILCS